MVYPNASALANGTALQANGTAFPANGTFNSSALVGVGNVTNFTLNASGW